MNFLQQKTNNSTIEQKWKWKKCYLVIGLKIKENPKNITTYILYEKEIIKNDEQFKISELFVVELYRFLDRIKIIFYTRKQKRKKV